METKNIYRVKRKKSELPSWFTNNLNHLVKDDGGEVEPKYSNNGEKFYLNKEELSMYVWILWVEEEITFNQWCYSDKEIRKLNDWFIWGLRWFRTTNPEMYMRLLD